MVDRSQLLDGHLAFIYFVSDQLLSLFTFLCLRSSFVYFTPQGGSEWIISVGDYVDNLFAALGSSDPREVRLELYLGFYVFHFRFVQVHFVFC